MRTTIVELLESRNLLSALPMRAHGATDDHDTIVVTFNQNNYTVEVNGLMTSHYYRRGSRTLKVVEIQANAGHDTITVESTGYDSGQLVRVLGGSGNDNVMIRTSTVLVEADGGAGSDSLNAGGSVFYTNPDDQVGVTLRGGTGNDSLVGGAGDDFLVAGKGNDTLICGMGEDTLFGSEGSDIIRMYAPQDGGTILDGGPGYDAVETQDGQRPWDEVVVRKVELYRHFI